MPQAHGRGEQGSDKLYYTRCLYAPGGTARQRRGRRKSKAERCWSGHASERAHERKLQVREYAEAHSKAG